MSAHRPHSRYREHARGVLLAVGLGLGICLVGLLVMGAFVWALT